MKKMLMFAIMMIAANGHELSPVGMSVDYAQTEFLKQGNPEASVDLPLITSNQRKAYCCADMSYFQDLLRRNPLRMDVVSAILDREAEIVSLHVRIWNTSNMNILIPLYYGPYKRRVPQNYSSGSSIAYYVVENDKCRNFLTHNFKLRGESSVALLKSTPELWNYDGVISNCFTEYETKYHVFQFRVIDILRVGEEKFTLRMSFLKPHSDTDVDYCEADFVLKVSKKDFEKFQKKKADREYEQKEEGIITRLPLELQIISACVNNAKDVMSLHVRLKNVSENAVEVDRRFRLECIADESEPAIKWAKEENFPQREAYIIEPGEEENIALNYRILEVFRRGKSRWRLKPNIPLCNAASLEIVTQRTDRGIDENKQEATYPPLHDWSSADAQNELMEHPIKLPAREIIKEEWTRY